MDLILIILNLGDCLGYVDDQNYILIKVSKTNDQLDDVSFMIESSDDLESWGNAEELVLDLNQSESTEYIYRSKQVIPNSQGVNFLD